MDRRRRAYYAHLRRQKIVGVALVIGAAIVCALPECGEMGAAGLLCIPMGLWFIVTRHIVLN